MAAMIPILLCMHQLEPSIRFSCSFVICYMRPPAPTVRLPLVVLSLAVYRSARKMLSHRSPVPFLLLLSRDPLQRSMLLQLQSNAYASLAHAPGLTRPVRTEATH